MDNEVFIDNKPQRLRNECEDAVFIAITLGEHIMRSGGEISRAEDTVRRVCLAYGAKAVDVIAILSVIVLSAEFENGTVNSSRRITEIGTHNLGRLSRLNDLSRRICREKPSKEEFLEKLHSINEKSQVAIPVRIVGGIVAAVGFTVFFGGGWLDAIFSGLIAVPMTLMMFLLVNTKMNNIIAKFVVCLIGGILAVLVDKLGLGCNADKIMIGNIMNVISGVLLTNSFRDLFGGDIMSGFFRMCTAVLDAVGIALGYAVAIITLGGITTMGEINWPISVILIASTVATMGMILQFGIEKRVIIWALISSILCCAAYEASLELGCGLFVASLIASAVAAAYSDFFAHFVKVPATVLIIPAIVPLVPGGSLYYTMYCAVNSDMGNFASYGLNALKIAVGLAIGVILVTAISRPINAYLAEKKSNQVKNNLYHKQGR